MVLRTFVTTKKTLIGYSRLRMTGKDFRRNLKSILAIQLQRMLISCHEFMFWLYTVGENCTKCHFSTPPHSSCFTSCFKAWRRCQPPPPQRGGSCSAAPVFKTHLFWSWNVRPTFLSLPPRHSPRAFSVMLTKCRISFGPESWYASYYRGHVLSQWEAGFAGRYRFNEEPSGAALF